MKAQLHRFRPRRHVVRTAEGGEEVVERRLVGQVDDCKAQAPLVTVSVEQVVLANTGIKQAARRDALRVVVIVFLPWRRDTDELGS